MVPISEQLVVIQDVACGERLGKMLDAHVDAGRFGPFVGQLTLSSLWRVVLRGRVGFCWAGGDVWFRYRLRRRPKAGDSGSPSGCVILQVELQRWWPNRVPLTWAVVRSVEPDALLSGPAVVGQDGVCDGGNVIVPDLED